MTPEQRRQQVEDACAAIILAGQQVTFDDVAARTGLGRATLYRNSDLRRIIEEHRARGKEAHTLSGLTTEIAHLRIALDAIATTVRRHEENSAASVRHSAETPQRSKVPTTPRLAG